MQKILFSIITLLSSFSLLACSTSENNNVNPNPSPSIEEDNNEDDKEEQPKEDENEDQPKNDDELVKNAMVVYFSATNHTESVANTIATHINSAIYKLEPVDLYTSEDLNYSNQNSRVVEEHLKIQDGERVNVELSTTSFVGFNEAQYIFLGAPVWWQQLSWVIENFVSENDFSNKTIIPFGTSASSGFNLNNLTPLTKDNTNVTWLSPQRFSSNASSNDVTSWIDSLGFNFK